MVLIGQRASENTKSENRNGNTETSIFSPFIDTAVDGNVFGWHWVGAGWVSLLLWTNRLRK